MFNRLTAKFLAKRNVKKIEKFLRSSKDYKVREIVFMDKDSEDFDDKFDGKSYYHYSCTDNGLDDGRIELFIPVAHKGYYDLVLWEMAMVIAVKAGFVFK